MAKDTINPFCQQVLHIYEFQDENIPVRKNCNAAKEYYKYKSGWNYKKRSVLDEN